MAAEVRSIVTNDTVITDFENACHGVPPDVYLGGEQLTLFMITSVDRWRSSASKWVDLYDPRGRLQISEDGIL